VHKIKTKWVSQQCCWGFKSSIMWPV